MFSAPELSNQSGSTTPSFDAKDNIFDNDESGNENNSDDTEDLSPLSDDDGDNNNTGLDPQGQHAPRSTIPTWLYTDYQNHCDQLRAETHVNMSGSPNMLRSGTIPINS